jgi:hypothetical protein
VDDDLFSIAMPVITLLVLVAFSTSVAATDRGVVWRFYVDSEKEILVNHHKLYAFGPATLDEPLLLLCHSSVAFDIGGGCACFVGLLLVK